MKIVTWVHWSPMRFPTFKMKKLIDWTKNTIWRKNNEQIDNNHVFTCHQVISKSSTMFIYLELFIWLKQQTFSSLPFSWKYDNSELEK